jgi:hypothetical protein
MPTGEPADRRPPELRRARESKKRVAMRATTVRFDKHTKSEVEHWSEALGVAEGAFIRGAVDERLIAVRYADRLRQLEDAMAFNADLLDRLIRFVERLTGRTLERRPTRP